MIDVISGTTGSESTEFTTLFSLIVEVPMPVFSGMAVVNDERGLKYLHERPVKIAAGWMVVQICGALYWCCLWFWVDVRWPGGANFGGQGGD